MPTINQRYSNLPDARQQHVSLKEIQQLTCEIRLLNKKITPADITWNNSANLTSRIRALNHADYICWIGHATFLLQLNQKTFLIDPFFSERASPVQWLGPKRFVPPALTISELPAIDYILVTHNHYDHLDRPALKAMANKERIKIIVPSGLGKTVQRWGYQHIIELGWHEKIQQDGISFTALPAYHYSRRGLFDLNKSWWCSYAITTSKFKLFHSGDTGYGPVFKLIGQQYGPFDYAMVGIGAYQPPAIMQAVHVNPEEALQIALDINAKNLLPMHWGAIVLASEWIAEPMQRLMQQYQKLNLADTLQIKLQNIGDIIALQ